MARRHGNGNNGKNPGQQFGQFEVSQVEALFFGFFFSEEQIKTAWGLDDSGLHTEHTT